MKFHIIIVLLQSLFLINFTFMVTNSAPINNESQATSSDENGNSTNNDIKPIPINSKTNGLSTNNTTDTPSLTTVTNEDDRNNDNKAESTGITTQKSGVTPPPYNRLHGNCKHPKERFSDLQDDEALRVLEEWIELMVQERFDNGNRELGELVKSPPNIISEPYELPSHYKSETIGTKREIHQVEPRIIDGAQEVIINDQHHVLLAPKTVADSSVPHNSRFAQIVRYRRSDDNDSDEIIETIVLNREPIIEHTSVDQLSSNEYSLKGRFAKDAKDDSNIYTPEKCRSILASIAKPEQKKLAPTIPEQFQIKKD